MDYKDNVGKRAWYIGAGKIISGLIYEARKTCTLIMPNDKGIEGFTEQIEYRFELDSIWRREKDVFFNKKDIVKNL